MNKRAPDQLDKVLALADSDHEGEALGALRMLRRLLERDNLSFSDIARAARKPGFSITRSFFSASQVELEAKIEQLNEDLQAHVEQNDSLSTQIDFWRRRAFELEQMLNLTQAEANRWKQTARETAERLWDMAQIAQTHEALTQVVEEVAQEDAETPQLKEAS